MKTPTTVAIDFDGVLHAYSKGWQDGGIYDVPVAGAKDALEEFLKMGWEVVIYSTRCYDRMSRGHLELNQVEDMKTWLALHGIPYTRIHTEPGKPVCKLFIDDNAFRFEGDWNRNFLLCCELVTKKFPRS